MKKNSRWVGALLALTLAGVACSNNAPDAQPPTTNTTTDLPSVTEAAQTAQEPQPAPLPQHRIAVRGDDFYDTVTGEPFVPRGVNYFNIVSGPWGFEDRVFGLETYDRERIAADFQRLSQNGFNTVRIFLDSCNTGPNCIARVDGSGLNAQYLDNIVEVMDLARQNNLYLILTSNDIPDNGGYGELANQGANAQIAGYRNAHYLTAQGVQAARTYWGHMMQGFVERNAPTDAVLAWSLLNEQWYFNDQPPFSLSAGTLTTANGSTYDLADPAQKDSMAAEGMLHFITEVRDEIRRFDPSALVTMGFFVPDFPNALRQGDFRYVDTASMLASAPLDFFDFHAYPGEDALAPIAENFGMTGYDARPIIMGEVGAFTDRYSSSEAGIRAVQSWIAESCGLGYDGWLYWGYYQAPQALGDPTQGFVDEDGAMMAALSPINQPDACTTTNIPTSNLAFEKPVTVSRALPEEPAQNAVDGNASTQWGAGVHPPQWIEIDFGGATDIAQVRLTVAQFPAGDTVHQLWGRASGESLRLLHEFSGPTAEGDILTWLPDQPVRGIQVLRVLTTSSPSWVSWREIEVTGP